MLKNKFTSNAIIEISMYNNNIKYEFNKKNKQMRVDRFIDNNMSYPFNYGFIPNTVSEDKDCIDTIIYSTYPIKNNTIIKIKLLGILLIEDENGIDKKILSVPHDHIDKYFKEINNYTDLPYIIIKKFEFFFSKYKDMDNNKWIKVFGWKNYKEAIKIINNKN